MNSGVSVIICCYNSASRIKDTLYYLSKQVYEPNLFWEIIVVDNASLDNSGEVAATFWKSTRTNVSLKVVNEAIPGLSAARKRGVMEANYNVVIFCDDDNHLEPNYVTTGNHLIRSREEIGIVGAWVKPKLPFNPGLWILDFYPALAIGKRAETPGWVDWIFGAGMVIKREIFLELARRGIDTMLSDRVGTKQTSGGDAEICVLARFIGYKIFFSPELQLYHAISAHRLSRMSFIKANHLNVYPLIYLYILERLAKDKSQTSSRLYSGYVIECLGKITHFFPRVLFGKHNFYSFIMLYQNIQLVFWMLFRRKKFRHTVKEVYQNLYHARA